MKWKSPVSLNEKHRRLQLYLLLFVTCLQSLFSTCRARDISFCGELIPIDNSFVANKLMNVIHQQVRYVNLQQLRSEARKYFPIIEYYLKSAGMPQDLKYIPIIESGFRNASSPAGAQGFWQLMKPTAKEWGLKVDLPIDERNDIYKATIAALKELARTYNMILRDHKIASWILTAASYNYGSGRLYNKIKTDGKDYFTMNLNPETALYVYKITAIKELFEYPELYIKNFQYNVFNQNAVKVNQEGVNSDDKTDFKNVEVKVNKDEKAPDMARIENVTKPNQKDLTSKGNENLNNSATLVGARIVSKHQNFKDGDEITIQLQGTLETLSRFQGKGTSITGKGWIIDDRVHIDLGFSNDTVILYDTDSEQGIALAALKKGEQVILRVQN